MCRNIKNLFNFDPSATDEEIRDASLQFVRKISGFNKPSQVNETAYNNAVKDVEKISHKLLSSLSTDATPKNRGIEAQKAKERSIKRFGNN